MYYIIVNPASRSGKGQKIWSSLEPVLQEKNISYQVHFSKKAGHVTDIVRSLCASFANNTSDNEFLKLIILGGDGTLNEALQGISDFGKVQIGYIPTGSSNDMARDLKLTTNPVELLNRILSCTQPVKTDIGYITFEHIGNEFSRHHSEEILSKRYFAVSSGIGFDAAVCEEALSSRFKNIMNKIGLGKLTYLGIALKQLIAAKKISCEMTLDDDQRISLPRFLFVAGMVHQFEGGGFKFCPDANSHDGLLDICAVGDIPKWLVLLALPTAFFGKHYMFNGIDHYFAKKICLQTSAPLWVHTDGEVSQKADTITMYCEKDKLQLLL